ncbi:MAG: hypothetical protein Q9207_000020 [Kuettlingeria erythrocarpa]
MIPQGGCRVGYKRINSQAARESKQDRKKLATQNRDKTATASEKPEEPSVRRNATLDPEQRHLGPEEQDQNQSNARDRLPDGLDARRARDTLEIIDVVPANQDNNLCATWVNKPATTLLEKEQDIHSSDYSNGIEIDNTIDDHADMNSLAAGILALHMEEGPKTSRRPWEEKVIRWRKQPPILTAVPEQEQDQSESQKT